jgi:hypothetical protein
MNNRIKIAIAAGVVVTGVAVGAVAVGAATGNGGDDTDTPITGPALDKASAAAVAFAGGGRVTGTEIGDEESYYEVEVTLDNGQQVDVQLDRQFNVVSSKGDVETNDDTGGPEANDVGED